jgi:uncharacterized damage-inducible protein DinB
MINSLKISFDRLEQQLDYLLQKVKTLRSEQQNFKPDAHAWSILQIFRHMMQSEGQINKYLRKKILGIATTRKAGFVNSFRSAILNFAMRLPLKFKVPDAIQVEFEERYDYEKLTADWKLLRNEISEFLEAVDEETAEKEIFRHPVVGRMSLLQGLEFMQIHLERHTKQVERIMEHPDFPKEISQP